MFFSLSQSWNNGQASAKPITHAVVMGTYNRGHLLKRSLTGYANQSIDARELALVVLDDDSTDGTRELLIEFAAQDKAPHIFYFGLTKPTGVTWRDSASFLNLGLSFAIHSLGATFVWATHPEIIPGKDVLLAGEHCPLGHYMSCKGYYLTPAQQEQIDTVPWQADPVAAVRQITGFYDDHPEIQGPAQDYQHYRMDTHKTWESWIFGGMRAEQWRKFGGFTEFSTWGSVDVDFHGRRRLLNIPTYTPQADHCMVIHQNHDDPTKNVITPRDMEACLAALPKYSGPASARKPELLDPSRWLVNQSGL